MTANSFTSVSLEPLLILVGVGRNAHLLRMIERDKRFGLNILKDTQEAISEYFAGTEEDEALERQLGIRFRWTKSGIPLLEDALVHLACRLSNSHIAGDHTIFLGEVESVEVFGGEPLLYLRGEYRRVEKAPE